MTILEALIPEEILLYNIDFLKTPLLENDLQQYHQGNLLHTIY